LTRSRGRSVNFAMSKALYARLRQNLTITTATATANSQTETPHEKPSVIKEKTTWELSSKIVDGKMLNSTSFTQLVPNAARAPSHANKSRGHRRGPSQGRRPKAERVISMSRHASHNSNIVKVPATATPNWTKNEKYCVTKLPGRPSQVDNIAQFRTSATFE
jgi:hypothetical protein